MSSRPAGIESGAEGAAAVLRRGGVIAYPTEAVWGLGCDPFNRDAALRILGLKRRGIDKGLLLVAAGMEQIDDLLAPLGEKPLAALRQSWPGHVTWLIPDPAGRYPAWIRGQHPTVAVRVSDHPVVSSICRAFGKPIVSTSANFAGEPEIRSAEDLRRQFGGEVDYVAKGGLGGRAAPSEIRDLLTNERIR